MLSLLTVYTLRDCRSQSSRQKGHSSTNRPGGMPGAHNRMSDSWVSSNTVLRKSGKGLTSPRIKLHSCAVGT